jgi:hypothetical protein
MDSAAGLVGRASGIVTLIYDVHLCSLLCYFLGSASVLCTFRTQTSRSFCNAARYSRHCHHKISRSICTFTHYS